jgi:hypothetical protein
VSGARKGKELHRDEKRKVLRCKVLTHLSAGTRLTETREQTYSFNKTKRNEKKIDTRVSYFSQICHDESRDWHAHLHVSQNKNCPYLHRDRGGVDEEPTPTTYCKAYDLRCPCRLRFWHIVACWLRAPAIRRSKILLRLARTLEGHVPTLVELEMVQTGRAIWEMPAQLGYLPECCEYGRETSLLVV